MLTDRELRREIVITMPETDGAQPLEGSLRFVEIDPEGHDRRL
jgi:hypothetical protein